MFEYSVYSNVSLIFECILKLRIFGMHIIYLLFYNYYKLTGRSVEKLATNHSTSVSRSPLVERFAASLSALFRLQLEDSTRPVLIGVEYDKGDS